MAQVLKDVIWRSWERSSEFLGIKGFLKDDEAKFRLWTGFKVTLIPVIVFFILVIFLWIILTINLSFFEAHGYPKIGELSETYYQYVISTSLDLVPYFLLFLFFLWLFGLYLAEMLLRPFKLIGDYCEKACNDEIAIYDPDFFTDLKLLTSFSEYFFNALENASKQGRLTPLDVPRKFTKIHKPVFESSFFLQQFIMMLVISIVVAFFIYITIVDVHHGMVKLSIEVLKQNKVMTYLFTQQQTLMLTLTWGVLLFHSLLYILLCLHLYSKVSAPAFGIFATMRSFVKGNFDSRVHLIGYSYVRGHTRRLNKYLDKIVRQIPQEP